MIEKHLQERYPGASQATVAVREFVSYVCRRYIDLGLADPNFENNLCCGRDDRFWQRLSEALVAHELVECGLNLVPSRNGPDILIQEQRRNLWIEVICPEPNGIPANWLDDEPNKVIHFPHEAILLRWTSAIKEKAEKLLGNPENNYVGYLSKSVVGPDDPYVIAINGRRLRRVFPSLNGISQLPFAAEAVFAVGPYQVRIDRQSLESTGAGHQHRPLIFKPSGSPVPAYTFLDPAFRAISAIWAADLDETFVIGNTKQLAVIHNPNAVCPLPIGLLPAHREYVAIRCNDEEYELKEIPGRLSVQA